MNIIIAIKIISYIAIFIIGATIGSLCATTINRISRNKKMTAFKSFCPNCNHKLAIYEKIPIFSYIFLGGKCKKCKKKISPSYLILEILFGIVILQVAIYLQSNLELYERNFSLDTKRIIKSIVNEFFIILYFIIIATIAGIDRKNRKIEKSVLYFGMIESCAYIMYLCAIDISTIYKYILYLITLIIILIIDSERQIKTAEPSYFCELLILVVIMIINTNEIIVACSIILTFIAINVAKFIIYLRNELNKSKKQEINYSKLYKYGFLFGMINLIFYFGNLVAMSIKNFWMLNY